MVLAHPFLHSSQPTQAIQPPRIHFSEDLVSNLASPPKIYVDTENTREGPPGERQLFFGNVRSGTRRTKPKGLPYQMPSSLRIAATRTTDSNPSVPIELECGEARRACPDSAPSTATPSGIRETWTKLIMRQQPKNGHGSSEPTSSGGTDGVTEMENKPQKRIRNTLIDVGNRQGLSGHSTQDAASVQTLKLGEGGTKAQATLASGLFSPPETQYRHSLQRRRKDRPLGASPPPPTLPRFSIASTASENDLYPRKKLATITYPLPIEEPPKLIPRTNFPKRFEVTPLFPQTHKVTYGQLIVMPSQNLLVDIREGERRAGRRGDRVLYISPDGREVKVFDAPHLSTPCILSEPLETWNLDDLPERYWKSYTFASKIVESIKKRTAQMVWYTPEAKFTLMSNSPKGDIHATFPCPSPDSKPHHVPRDPSDSPTKMKIKLSIRDRILEISRYVAAATELGTRGHWVVKTLSIAEEQLKLRDEFGPELNTEERHGLNCVIGGLKVCEAVEGLCVEGQNCKEEATYHPVKPDATEKLVAEIAFGAHEGKTLMIPSPRSEASKSVPIFASGLPSSIAPRPRRISCAAAAHVSPITRSGTVFGLRAEG